jgi:hypothetical protein
MANTDDVINVAQGKLEQLIGEDRSGVGKSEQGVVSENSPQAHSPCMKNRFMTETAQAGVSVDYVDLFADDDVPEYGEEGEDCRHSRFAVYNEEWNVVDLESIGEVPDSGAPLVCMGNDDHFMAAIYEFLHL